MKVKELRKILKDYRDYEIEFSSDDGENEYTLYEIARIQNSEIVKEIYIELKPI